MSETLIDIERIRVELADLAHAIESHGRAAARSLDPGQPSPAGVQEAIEAGRELERRLMALKARLGGHLARLHESNVLLRALACEAAGDTATPKATFSLKG